MVVGGVVQVLFSGVLYTGGRGGGGGLWCRVVVTGRGRALHIEAYRQKQPPQHETTRDHHQQQQAEGGRWLQPWPPHQHDRKVGRRTTSISKPWPAGATETPP